MMNSMNTSEGTAGRRGTVKGDAPLTAALNAIGRKAGLGYRIKTSFLV